MASLLHSDRPFTRRALYRGPSAAASVALRIAIVSHDRTALVGFGSVEDGGGEFCGRCGQRVLARRDGLLLCGRGGFGRRLFVRLRIVIGVVLVVVVDGGEGTQEKAADVGEDGGAARGDAAFGEEIVESAEGVVDTLGPLEIVGF